MSYIEEVARVLHSQAAQAHGNAANMLGRCDLARSWRDLTDDQRAVWFSEAQVVIENWQSVMPSSQGSRERQVR